MSALGRGAPRCLAGRGAFPADDRAEVHEASTPDVLSGGPPWSGLYGPVLWLILFIHLAARSWKECTERIFSGCPFGDTATRVSGPWLVAEIERCLGVKVLPTGSTGSSATQSPATASGTHQSNLGIAQGNKLPCVPRGRLEPFAGLRPVLFNMAHLSRLASVPTYHSRLVRPTRATRCAPAGRAHAGAGEPAAAGPALQRARAP